MQNIKNTAWKQRRHRALLRVELKAPGRALLAQLPLHAPGLRVRSAAQLKAVPNHRLRAWSVVVRRSEQKKLSLVERPQMKIALRFSAKGSDRVEELALQWSRLNQRAAAGRAAGGRAAGERRASGGRAAAASYPPGYTPPR